MTSIETTDAAQRSRRAILARERAATARRSLLPGARAVARRADDPADLDLTECVALLQARLLSSVELLAACEARIARYDGRFGAFSHRSAELAASQARRADDRLARSAVRSHGPAPVLCGVPIALKDLFAVEGQPLTAGSPLLRDNVAPTSSTAWRRLEAAGMVLIGQTTMTEFAIGDLPATRSPWGLDRHPGASSVGSGVALAARMTPAALGTDTGGSVRTPAAWQNITAIKPTYGRISARGVVPLAWNWDHVGPMARTAADCALLLDALAGRDAHDAATHALPAWRTPTLRPGRGPRPLDGRRIGVVRDGLDGMDPGVARAYETVLRRLRALGAALTTVALPVEDERTTTAYQREWLGFHRQFLPARRSEYGTVTQAMLAMAEGTDAGVLATLGGEQARLRYSEAWRALLRGGRLDAVALPTMLQDGMLRDDPWPAGTRGVTRQANDSGLPAISIPAPLSHRTKLPVGVQLIGQPLQEATILQLAIDYQAHHADHATKPPLIAS